MPPILVFLGVAAQAPDIAAQAEAARDADRVDEAIPLYRKALAARPAWADGWWSLGTLLYDQDKYADASAAFRKAADLSPKSGDAWVMLGLCEAKLGKSAAALKNIQRGQELGGGGDPKLRPVMLFTQGSLLLEAGDFGKAQEALDDVARDSGPEPGLVTALGSAVLGIKAPAADPETRELVRRAGSAEYAAARKDDLERAKHEYQRLAYDYPKTRNVQFAFGRFLLANHMDDEAAEAFQRELQNTPDHLLARLGIAGVKASTDPAAGLPYARQAVALAPKLPEAHYLLGLLLLNSGQPKDALAELETAQRGNARDSRVYFQLARAYTELNRKEDAARARAEFVRLEKQR
jgi:predicted Zn-dependent protease